MASFMNSTEITKLQDIISRSLSNKITYSISMMLGETFEYNLRKIDVVEFSSVDGIIERFANQLTCAIYMRTEGDVRLGMLLFLTENEAKVLMAKLVGKSEVKTIDAMGRSSLSEIGNILLAGSFLNSISESTGFRIDCSVPGFALEHIRAILREPVAEIAATTDKIVFVDAQLTAASGIKINIVITIGIEDAIRLASNSKEGII